MSDKFPVPVDGQQIPRGWFRRLVSFINSLILRGDGEYFAVNRTNAGTTLRPTTKLIDLLSARSGAPASSGGGGSTGIQATVSDGTASVTASGSAPLLIEEGANIRLTGGTNGELIISSTAWGPPDYSSPIEQIDANDPYPGYAYPVWLIGMVGVDTGVQANTVACSVEFGTNSEYYIPVFDWYGGTPPPTDQFLAPMSVFVPANTPFQITYQEGASFPQTSNVRVSAYPCLTS